MKKTPWYPASIKPVRVGWYECAYQSVVIPEMRYWDGQIWRMSDNFDDGPSAFAQPLTCSKDMWRGLTKPSDGL